MNHYKYKSVDTLVILNDSARYAVKTLGVVDDTRGSIKGKNSRVGDSLADGLHCTAVNNLDFNSGFEKAFHNHISCSPGFLYLVNKLKSKYQTVSDAQRQIILELYDTIVDNFNSVQGREPMKTRIQLALCKRILIKYVTLNFNNVLTNRKLNKWLRKRESNIKRRKRGKQVNAQFEADLWAMLLVTRLVDKEYTDPVTGERCTKRSVVVVENVCYSYGIIRLTGSV